MANNRVKAVKAVHVQVDEELKVQLEEKSKRDERSVGAVCRLILKGYFEREKEVANGSDKQ